jgi:hypothetical protein
MARSCSASLYNPWQLETTIPALPVRTIASLSLHEDVRADCHWMSLLLKVSTEVVVKTVSVMTLDDWSIDMLLQFNTRFTARHYSSVRARTVCHLLRISEFWLVWVWVSQVDAGNMEKVGRISAIRWGCVEAPWHVFMFYYRSYYICTILEQYFIHIWWPYLLDYLCPSIHSQRWCACFVAGLCWFISSVPSCLVRVRRFPLSDVTIQHIFDLILPKLSIKSIPSLILWWLPYNYSR